MRTATFRTFLAAGAILLLASGCARELPSGPTQAEVDAYWDTVLAATWDNTTASQELERPVVESEGPIRRDTWWEVIMQCLSGEDVAFSSLSYNNDTGFDIDFEGSIDQESRNAAELALYTCVARHPQDVVADGTLLSDAQMEYIYDYYQQWLTPCLAEQGAPVVGESPGRDLFRIIDGQWSPYSQLGPRTETEVARLTEACGPNRPPLD